MATPTGPRADAARAYYRRQNVKQRRSRIPLTDRTVPEFTGGNLDLPAVRVDATLVSVTVQRMNDQGGQIDLVVAGVPTTITAARTAVGTINAGDLVNLRLVTGFLGVEEIRLYGIQGNEIGRAKINASDKSRIFIDNFDRAGPSLGPDWTTPVIGPSNQRDPMEIASFGTAQSTNTANWHDAAYTGQLTPDDQFAEARVAVLDGGASFNNAFGVYVRATIATRQAYFASLWYDTANAKRYWEWGKLQAGSAVFFGFDYFLGPVWPVGTVIRLEVIGTNFRLYIDGVLEDTGVDSEFTSGHPCMLTSISINTQDDIQFARFRSGRLLTFT